MDERKREFSTAKESLNKWFQINTDPQWATILQGLVRILKADHKIIDGTKFVSLISDIETFLDLQGRKDANTDTLINLYSTPEWKTAFEQIATTRSNKETLGQWVQNIRNALTHPKTAQKKANGKYWEIASDSIKLHKVYASISGLLVKGILIHLGGIAADDLERFIKRFIEARASFYSLTFE